MTNELSIVLLGGSGLGPWAWERVAPMLERDGAEVLTPQLRGTGNDSTPAAEVSLRNWTDDLFNVLTEIETSNTVLVAHSFAGYVAAAALERDPSIVRSTLFLDAALPAPNRSWFEVMGPQVESFMKTIAEDDSIPFFTRGQLDEIHPDHGLGNRDWHWLNANVAAQPVRTYAEPAITCAIDPRGTELAYIRCLRTVPPVADIDERAADWTFRRLPTGHWPMITDPAATAAVIGELAGR